MKESILLTIILLSAVFQSKAQNYQSFYSGRIISYQDQWNYIKFVRVDSVFFQTDSVLIPFGGFHEIEYMECYTIDGPSWLGKEIIIQDDGWNLFVTSDEDTVHIKTAAMQGDSWTAFQRPGELIITATVLSHDLQTFLGIQDSVKTIGFQAFNHLMQPITHAVNARTVAASKNYGLVRTLNFALFPDISPYIGNDWDGLREFDIIGMSDPQVGVQNLTWMEVHDFQPGDEIHVYSSFSFFDYPNEIKQSIHRYLDREDFVDSVTYTVERIQSTLNYSSQGNTFEFIHDTITETYRPDENFDKLPGEIVEDEEWADAAFFYKMTTEWHQARIKPSEDYWLFPAFDNCWNFLIIDGCISDYTWYKGLGGPYHYCNLWGERERSLVYYKKGNETWGDPLVILGMKENLPENNISIFPNPAADMLWVNCSTVDLPLTVEFYDLYGRLIKAAVVTETAQQIGLQDFTKGLYLYRIINVNGLISQGKAVIE